MRPIPSAAISNQSQAKSKPASKNENNPQQMNILGYSYKTDEWTNISPRILEKVDMGLHKMPRHPLNLLRRRIQNYFYKEFVNRRGNPEFSVWDSISPVVTTHQNFDSLLIPENHPSRVHHESYYVNQNTMLRAHTSAHQDELMRSGLDSFLVIGDVYRRDTIDATHYPVFHQVEGVRLFNEPQILKHINREDLNQPNQNWSVFEGSGHRNKVKQKEHTQAAVVFMEHALKNTLLGLTKELFPDMEYRWVDAYFPFTHPSWELEIYHSGEWMEVLGCGVMEQQLLHNAGVGNKLGWAFGLGLERLAMKLYQIPDIRLFWSKDDGFLKQFDVENPATPIIYKEVSQFPPCKKDISFWISDIYTSNDFYDLVRNVGGDVIESVTLVDEFKHPKSGRVSHCYSINYRHMEKTLTNEEVNVLHKEVVKKAEQELLVQIR